MVVKNKAVCFHSRVPGPRSSIILSPGMYPTTLTSTRIDINMCRSNFRYWPSEREVPGGTFQKNLTSSPIEIEAEMETMINRIFCPLAYLTIKQRKKNVFIFFFAFLNSPKEVANKFGQL